MCERSWNLSLTAISVTGITPLLRILNPSDLLFLSAWGIYDYLLGLPDEYRYVWKQKFTGATVLFLLNRYILLVRIIVTVITYAAWGTDNVSYASQL